MATEGPIISAEVDGWQVTSNTATKESLAALSKEKSEPKEIDPSEAASELGKLGGEAAAKARAKAAKEAKKAEKEAVEAKSEPEQLEIEAKEPEEPEKPEEKEKPLGKPRDDPRARMLEATRKESEAKKALAAERAERERDRAEIQRLKEEFENLKRGKPTEEVKAEPGSKAKPKAEDFEDYEAYLDARDEWNQEQWAEKNRRQEQEAARDRQLQTAITAFVESTADIRDQIKDTVGSLASSFQLQPGQKETGENWIANELIFSPESARTLALFLHEHPDELQRIAALQTPRAVSREMAKLEARLEAATAGNGSEPEKAVSKAPPPIKPVSGASYVTESDEWKPGMSLDEYARVWNKRKRIQR